MMKTLKRMLRSDEGQDLAEYGIALAVVGTAAASAALAISTEIRTFWVRALQTIILTVLSE